jgi:hypothetical protein
VGLSGFTAAIPHGIAAAALTDFPGQQVLMWRADMLAADGAPLNRRALSRFSNLPKLFVKGTIHAGPGIRSFYTG